MNTYEQIRIKNFLKLFNRSVNTISNSIPSPKRPLKGDARVQRLDVPGLVCFTREKPILKVQLHFQAEGRCLVYRRHHYME